MPMTSKKLYYLVSNGFVVRTYISSVPTHDRFILIYQNQFTAAAYANGQLRRYLRSTNRLVSTTQTKSKPSRRARSPSSLPYRP